MDCSLTRQCFVFCVLCYVVLSAPESDEQLARRLQAEEFASLGLSPVSAYGSSSGLSGGAAADMSSYSYPALSDPSFAASHSHLNPYLHQQPQASPQPSPSSSPSLRSHHQHNDPNHPNNPSALPLLPPARLRPAQRVRQHAIDNLNQSPPQHSKRILTLYFVYAAAELVTSITLLSLHWHDSCNVPLRVWIILHSARWLFFLPLAVHQRAVAAAAASSAASGAGLLVSDSTRRLKLWLKYAVFVIWIVGLYWLFTADASSCNSDGGGVLFQYSIVLVVLYGVRLALPLVFVLLLCLCLPCVLLFISYITPNPGASRDTIQSLPTRTYHRPPASAANASANGSSAAEAEAESPSCAICMQVSAAANSLTHPHAACAAERFTGAHTLCPLCLSVCCLPCRSTRRAMYCACCPASPSHTNSTSSAAIAGWKATPRARSAERRSVRRGGRSKNENGNGRGSRSDWIVKRGRNESGMSRKSNRSGSVRRHSHSRSSAMNKSSGAQWTLFDKA